jgi:hypothetical protein
MRVTPDIEESLATNVATGQGKLYARIDVTVGRNIAGGVAGAARKGIQHVVVDFCGGSARVTDGINEGFFVEDSFERSVVNIEVEDRAVAIHLRRNRRIQSAVNS